MAATKSPTCSEPQTNIAEPVMASPQDRKIIQPYQILDVPGFDPGFSTSVDWSAQNIISVILGKTVYLWNTLTRKAAEIRDFFDERSDFVDKRGCRRCIDNALKRNSQNSPSSIQFNANGERLAIGMENGKTEIWDVISQKRVQILTGHASSIKCLVWNGDILCSSSSDMGFIQTDCRNPREITTCKSDGWVTALKWSPDYQFLASGGHRIAIWDLRKREPYQVYVQQPFWQNALAWSPHDHRILCSGNSNSAMCFWNTSTGELVQQTELDSPILNIAWSQHCNELVTTHDNRSPYQTIIWKYPTLDRISNLTGHTSGVYELATSPDGESIVTGAGREDKTLRFWHVFGRDGQQRTQQDRLNLLKCIR